MIYIIWAAPRKGKTYFATSWIVDTLKAIHKGKHHKNKVFSNYPVYHKKWGSSLYWNRETINYEITDSLIVIDEAYRDYSSRKWHKFLTEEHTFFATNGHNNNDIVFIVHGINRLDPVIREMADQFYFVKKYGLPFIGRPLFFKIESYLDEMDIAQRYRRDSVHGEIFLRFKKDVANAYNTHFFREMENSNYDYISWTDLYTKDKVMKIEDEDVTTNEL